MSKRKHTPDAVATEVLVLSRRRCCLCFGLNSDVTEKMGQIAHLDQDSSNSDVNNLAFLCLQHHAQYDARSRQAKGLQKTEVEVYRDRLYRHNEPILEGEREWQVSIAARLSEVDMVQVHALIRQLEDCCRGVSISFVRRKAGSVVLVLRSKVIAFETISVLFAGGWLTHLGEYVINSISDQSGSDVSSDQNPTTSDLAHALVSLSERRSGIDATSRVHPSAQVGSGVTIGPFCVVGPNVSIGDDTILESHVTLQGKTTLGRRNRLFPGCVIGGEPQDVSYQDTDTQVIVGDDNIFREGVTVNRGVEREDGCTRIGNGNMFMANSHVAHNCRIFDRVILVNGVLLGGHVHVQKGAIVSGNSVVHHFSTLGRLSFVSGGCRVPHDIPPFMLAAGNDNPTLKTVNIVGMRRAGISEETIQCVRDAFRMLYRQHRKLEEVRAHFEEALQGDLPYELAELLQFIANQRAGKLGRTREALRDSADLQNPEDFQNRIA